MVFKPGQSSGRAGNSSQTQSRIRLINLAGQAERDDLGTMNPTNTKQPGFPLRPDNNKQIFLTNKILKYS